MVTFELFFAATSLAPPAVTLQDERNAAVTFASAALIRPWVLVPWETYPFDNFFVPVKC